MQNIEQQKNRLTRRFLLRCPVVSVCMFFIDHWSGADPVCISALLLDSYLLNIVVSGTVLGDSCLEHTDTVTVASGLDNDRVFLYA